MAGLVTPVWFAPGPPASIWLHRMRQGRTQRLRLAYRRTAVAGGR